jgi:hypothetical protein
MSNLTEKLREVAQPSIISGVIAAGGAVYLYGVDSSNKIPFFGLGEVNSLLAIGGTVAGSVAVSEILHDTVLTWIPHNQYVNAENRLLAPILAGGSTYLLLREGVSQDTSIMNAFVLGAGSAVVGKYASDMVSNRM